MMKAQIEEVASAKQRPSVHSSTTSSRASFNSSTTSSRASPVLSSRSAAEAAYVAGPLMPRTEKLLTPATKMSRPSTASSLHSQADAAGDLKEAQRLSAGLLNGKLQVSGNSGESPRSLASENQRGPASSIGRGSSLVGSVLEEDGDSSTRLQTPQDGSPIKRATARVVDGEETLQRMIENLQEENASLRRQNKSVVRELARTRSETKLAAPERPAGAEART